MAENTKQQNEKKRQISRIIAYYDIALPTYYENIVKLKNENGINSDKLDPIINDIKFKYTTLTNSLNELKKIANKVELGVDDKLVFSNIITALSTKELINDLIKEINSMSKGVDIEFLENRRSTDIEYKKELIKIFQTYMHVDSGGKRKSRRNRKSKKGKKSRKARKSRRKSNRRRR